ncbi:MAG TPA: ABC transporter permease [Acidobacteriaceae bacterium]|nr:ABC transporter permease [Acidobacteriaceae bacterium]
MGVFSGMNFFGLRQLWNGWRAAQRNSREALDEEMRFHIEEAIAAKVEEGMDPGAARRAVMVEFGGIEASREEAYRLRPGWLVELFWLDAKYALRGFRRSPAFAVTAILTLALAIGATTAVFSVVDRILFRPLPYADDSRVMSIGLSQSLEKQEFTLGGFFFDWRAHQQPFTDITYERGTYGCNLTEVNPRNLMCGLVAQNFLTVMGVQPVLGRNFLPEEDLPHGPAVALLTYGLWLSRYHRDPGVVGKTIPIDGTSTKIVGVLPANFQMPRLDDVDVVLPAAVDQAAQHVENSGIGVPLWAFARLKPGVSVDQARAAMMPLFLHVPDWIHPEDRVIFEKDFHLVVRPVREREMQEAIRAAWVLLAAVIAVLLIACANVAGLFSARGAARDRELAVRSALGATRMRIAGQALTEALLLAMAGALAGFALAAGLLRIFVAIAPAGAPFLEKARLDLRVAAFAVVVALLCTVVFGLLTSMQKPRPIAEVSRGVAGGSHLRLRRTLVVAQIAVSVVLATGALLLVKSFHNIEAQKLGFQSDGLVTVRVTLNGRRYASSEEYKRFYLRAEAELRSLPGVSGVAITNSMPPDDKSWHQGARFDELQVAGQPAPAKGMGGAVMVRKVTPEYFPLMGISMIAGRGFAEMEREMPADRVVISAMLAQRLFPNGGAVGQRINDKTVEGVAANVKNAGLDGQDLPELYDLQAAHADWNWHSLFVVRSGLPLATLEPEIEKQIAEIDPMAPMEVESVSRMVDRLADRPRFETALLGFFALAGLVIAVIGLYGVTAYSAARRTQEMGIRIALGATRAAILRIAAWEGVRLVLAGSGVGIVAALMVTQLLRSLLFGVGPRDPWTLAAAAGLLGVTAMLATLIPARRAMRIDPVEALRQE